MPREDFKRDSRRSKKWQSKLSRRVLLQTAEQRQMIQTRNLSKNQPICKFHKMMLRLPLRDQLQTNSAKIVINRAVAEIRATKKAVDRASTERSSRRVKTMITSRTRKMLRRWMKVRINPRQAIRVKLSSRRHRLSPLR